ALAAGGEEVTPHALAGDVLARRRKLVGDLRPVALELLGDHLGEAGQRALSHLGAGNADDDGLVGLHEHPGVDLGAGVGGLGIAERQAESKREPATSGSGADQERAAVDLWHEIHGILPAHVLATAAWMPARTCW